MDLVIVRHAQTQKNAGGIILTNGGGSLTDLGKQQAENVALKLRSKKFDAIYSSDLERAGETTKYIIKYHKNTTVQYKVDLREINVGIFGNLPISVPNFIAKIGSNIVNHTGLKLPGTESVGDLKLRLVSLLNEIYADYPNGKVLIVTHGVTMRAIQAVLEGNRKLNIKPVANCEVWYKKMPRKII